MSFRVFLALMGMSVPFQLRMITRLVTWPRILILMIARRSWIRFSPATSRKSSSFVSMSWSCSTIVRTNRRVWNVSWLKWILSKLGKLKVRSRLFSVSWVFRTYLLLLGNCQVVWEDGFSWHKSSWQSRPLAFGWADQPSGHCDYWVADPLLKNSKKTVLLLPTIVIS